jgi:hypothetical protein
LRGVLSAYFERLKIGDLVVVPPSAYGSAALIGEMIEDAANYVEVRVPRRYGGNSLTGRRVRWLAQIIKRELPGKLLDALEHPVAIYLLAKSVRAPIYEAAYGTYYDLSGDARDFTTRFDLSAAQFSTDIDFRFQAFFNAIASNVKAIDEKRALKAPRAAAFDDLGDYAPTLKSNVNSPGSLVLIAKRATPVIAAVLFALAVTVGDDAATAAKNGHIIIGNSKAPAGDPCTATVAKSVLDQLAFLGLDKWPEACELARRASDGSGATSNIKVVK